MCCKSPLCRILKPKINDRKLLWKIYGKFLFYLILAIVLFPNSFPEHIKYFI